MLVATILEYEGGLRLNLRIDLTSKTLVINP